MAIVAACVAGAQPVFAQPEEPVVIGKREEPGGIKLDFLHGAVELIMQRITDTREVAGQGRLRDREDLIRPTLELSTAGYIGRRELFEFDLLGRLNLRQRFLSSETSGLDFDTLETFAEFDTSGVFFSQSMLPVTIFARRDQTLLTRPFGGTLDASVTEFGTRMNLRSDVHPMTFEYRRRIQDQDDPLNNSGFTSRQHTLAYRGQFRPSIEQHLVWSYTLDLVDQTGTLRPTNSFTRQDATVTHTFRFGDLNQNELRSDLRFFSDTGDAQLTRLRLLERLDFDHGPDLRSRFEYLFDVQERPTFTQMLHRGTALVEHHLFESLTTIAEAGGEYLTSTDGDFTSLRGFGSLDLRYRKRAPAGMIFATVDLVADYRDDSDRGEDIFFNNESLAFNLSGLATIDRRNVDPSSVIIRDLAGLITFIENVDYRLLQLGDRLEVQLIPGGDIAPGDITLTDFTQTPEPANTTLTLAVDSTLRYRFTETAFKGLSPFVRYFNQSQDREAKGPFILPISDIESIVYGVEYDRWGLRLRAQHEDRDSTLSPLRETLVEGQWAIRTGQLGTFVLGARYNDLDRVDVDIQTRISSFTARWNGRIVDGLTGDALLIYRMEDESTGRDSTSFEQRLNLIWRKGLTEVFFSIRNSFNDSNSTDTDSQVLLLGFRRSF